MCTSKQSDFKESNIAGEVIQFTVQVILQALRYST